MSFPASRLSILCTGFVTMTLFGVIAFPHRLRSQPAQPPQRASKQAISPKAISPPRFDRWRIVGPGGGGAQYNPAISPLDPNIVLVACDMGGSYISVDGGTSWREFNLRSVVRNFGFDPADRNVIYAAAGTTGLWRSEDLGRKWSLIFPDSITNLQIHDDEAETMLTTRAGYLGGVVAFAIDPQDSKTIYLLAGRTLFISRNLGKTWEKKGTVGAAMRIFVDPASPPGNRSLYLAGSTSVGVFENGAWREGSLPPGVKWAYSVSAGFPANGGKPWIYVASDAHAGAAAFAGGVFLTKDGGQSWLPAYQGFKSFVGDYFPDIQAVAVSPHQPALAYVSYNGLLTPSTGKQKFFGVAKTEDAGTNWKLVWKESYESAPNVTDSWLGQSYGPDWGENPLGLAVAPSNPEIVFGTDLGRTMRSRDGGQTWQPVYSQRLSENGYTSTGLDVTTSYGVHFDPFDSKRIFITYTDIGLFRSEDGGASWIHSIDGIPRAWRNTVYWLTFDPAVRGRMWAVASDRHDLPRLRMILRMKNVKDFHGGVLISEDGGRSWKPSVQGMPDVGATHILLDPSSPPNARVLYVAAFDVGVYKSTDGGKSWTLKDHGLPSPTPRVWRLAQGKDGVLYAVTERRSEDGKYGNDNDGMLFRSRNGAETWERVALPDGVNGPVSLTVDPESPSRMYLSAWARYTRYMPDGTQGGIFVSTDGGE
ncbi:MAG: hypothetical protein ABSB35_19160, partial [Bryobacteraceae bacterium]